MENSILVLEGCARAGEEPSLKDVLLAANFCKSSLYEVAEQLKGIREEIYFLRHDAQKVHE